MLGFGFLPSLWEGTGGATPAPSTMPPEGRPRIPVAMYIDNTPVEWLGLTVARAPNWLSGAASPAPKITPTDGLTGGRYDAMRARGDLVITLTGTFLGVTLANRATVINTFTAALRGLKELRFPDGPDVVLRGQAGPVVVTGARQEAQFAEPQVTISVEFHCADTARYARHARQVVVGTTPAAIRLGNLASGGKLLVFGPITGALDVDLLGPNGARWYTLALRDVDIETGGFLSVHFDAPHAILVTDAAGIVTSVSEWRSVVLSSRWWKPSPFFNDALGYLAPSLRLSTGSGVYTYNEAWEH